MPSAQPSTASIVRRVASASQVVRTAAGGSTARRASTSSRSIGALNCMTMGLSGSRSTVIAVVNPVTATGS